MLSGKMILWRTIARTGIDEPLPRQVRAELKKVAEELYNSMHEVDDARTGFRFTPKRVEQMALEIVGLTHREVRSYQDQMRREIYGTWFLVDDPACSTKGERGRAERLAEAAGVEVHTLEGWAREKGKKLGVSRKRGRRPKS